VRSLDKDHSGFDDSGWCSGGTALAAVADVKIDVAAALPGAIQFPVEGLPVSLTGASKCLIRTPSFGSQRERTRLFRVIQAAPTTLRCEMMCDPMTLQYWSSHAVHLCNGELDGRYSDFGHDPERDGSS
jgi:hypothetical protein